MPIQFNSKLKSAVANATFMDRTVDTDTVGKVDLLNPDSTSIQDIQLQINKNKKVVFPQAAISDGDQLTPDSESMDQEFRLIGNSAPVTLNSLPFDQNPIDGTTIVLVGHDDTFTVTLQFNNSISGCYINGNATLGFGNSITLKYNSDIQRYVEVGRNF